MINTMLCKGFNENIVKIPKSLPLRAIPSSHLLGYPTCLRFFIYALDQGYIFDFFHVIKQRCVMRGVL